MEDATATWQPATSGRPDGGRALTLVLVAFPHDPTRVGEVARVAPGEDRVLGRHGTLDWVRQRPDDSRRCGSLTDPHLSRQQLRVRAERDALAIENLGRLPLRLNGVPVTACAASPGDVLQIADRVLLFVTTRPPVLPGLAMPDHAFGAPDAEGILGESEAAWVLRERVRFLARREQHVLVLGESGTGKELVARALHGLSVRSARPMLARSAATIPESLVDAELFGNAAGYPNPGMPARPGLIGEADGTTLFLDELGELPVEQQARLLRVMDAGEYTRLGEARPRTADLRVVAATNRDPDALKHDVLARFPLRLQVPPLGDRREDVPLLAVHLLRTIADGDPELRQRFFEGDHPRLDVELVRRLITHPYATHVRELEALLWQSIGASTGHTLEVPPQDFAVTAPLPEASAAPVPASALLPSGEVDPFLLDPALVQAVLDRHGGRQEPAWRELGLASRHVLARLVKKHGLRVRGKG